jgi:hypothetical protein
MCCGVWILPLKIKQTYIFRRVVKNIKPDFIAKPLIAEQFSGNESLQDFIGAGIPSK